MMMAAAGASSRPLSSPADDERGASATEYGLLITGIAAVVAMSVYLFGTGVLGLFVNTCTLVMSQMGGTC